MPTLTHNSEYIRRDYNKEQEVTTDLDFKGNVLVKTPTQDNNPVNKKYIDDIKQNIIDEIGNMQPNVEKLSKIEWTFTPMANANTLSDSCGMSFFHFLGDEGRPHQLVAFSLDEATKITNFNNAYLMGKVWTGYFAPVDFDTQANAIWTLAGARQILSTVTPEDQAYLDAYPYIIKVKVQLVTSVSYNYLPFSIFQQKVVKIPSSAADTATAGQNCEAPTQPIKVWIDEEESLNLFNTHIRNIIFNLGMYAGAHTYTTLRMGVRCTLNDKFVMYDHTFNQYRQDKTMTNSSYPTKYYTVSLNLTPDETYNKATISPLITGLISNNKTPILYWREWDDTLQEFVFKERTYAEANADVPT